MGCQFSLFSWLTHQAVFCYLRPINSTLDPHGPLSNTVPRGMIEEVNKELKKRRPNRKSEASTPCLPRVIVIAT